MHYLVAAIVAIHGLAHLVGFVVPWRLAQLEEMPYSTTLLAGKLDVGAKGIRLVGLLWLLAALGYLGTAVAIACLSPWWLVAIFSVTAFSLLLCVLGWPHSKIGLIVDVGILAIFAVGRILGWSSILSLE